MILKLCCAKLHFACNLIVIVFKCTVVESTTRVTAVLKKNQKQFSKNLYFFLFFKLFLHVYKIIIYGCMCFSTQYTLSPYHCYIFDPPETR